MELRQLKKVLLLGSGGLSIGQAGEFDYSGTQAVKAFQEEGIDVVVVNPNIATVQTDPKPGVTVYLYPVDPAWVEKIIEKERPDAIVGGFGGQTALNCVLVLEEKGILEKYGVRSLGTSAASLRLTEDRKLFAQAMREIGVSIPPSAAVSNIDDAAEAAQNVGFPVIVRAAFALGGLGSGFATNQEGLRELVSSALSLSPQVLVEKALKGWKEVEYEVMRDSRGNVITICNMENLDPLGIHTGDSIVVAPSQTLSDTEYQHLRNAAIRIAGSLEIIGECNVQFALNPHSLEFYVIEVNARLSRSSALASKATGYPIAYIAAKVVLGNSLVDLKNPVTGITTAFYEPSLDYVTVKIPRWDLTKFQGSSRLIGSAMKSVGEVMSIGRNFHEAIQKAARMVTENALGLGMRVAETSGYEKIKHELSHPTDQRLFWLLEAFRENWTLEEIHQTTSIDPWFLARIQEMVKTESEIKSAFSNAEFDQALNGIDLRNWKILGFGDEQIAALAIQSRSKETESLQTGSAQIRELSLKIRRKRIERKIVPFVKKIDTTSAEYPSPSNYFYMTYQAERHHDSYLPVDSVRSAMVLGSGCYRIGSSVEFDWCAVGCANELTRLGWKSILVNCNPETVSTDFNSSDRLYFEELTLERILDIADLENPEGVIVSMGGQVPNNLAVSLTEQGVRLLGHPSGSIELAENRYLFSRVLDQLGIGQPHWAEAKSREDIDTFVGRYGFPVLVRPSYVLSGAAMNVAQDRESLERFLARAKEASPGFPVVLTQFIEGALELELDGVACAGKTVVSVISEHIENAGTHSGDSTMTLPPLTLSPDQVFRMKEIGALIAESLKLNGPFNIQFLLDQLGPKVIECNARAARSFPFVSKVISSNLSQLATQVMVGFQDFGKISDRPSHLCGVKAPMFSFGRLLGVDPVLGVEMASTGEVGCLAETHEEALLLAMFATGIRIPEKGVLVSSGPKSDKKKLLNALRVLVEIGIPLYATRGTAAYLAENGILSQIIGWPGEDSLNATDLIQSRRVDLVINIPKDSRDDEILRNAEIRKSAASHGCSLLTDAEKAVAFLDAFSRYRILEKTHQVMSLSGYRGFKESLGETSSERSLRQTSLS